RRRIDSSKPTCRQNRCCKNGSDHRSVFQTDPYMHGVISNEVSLHHIAGRTAPGCHKKQLPLCRWHHQHAAPAEVRAKYPWLVPVHADGVVGGKKEFTLLNKSEMELLADAYEMANIIH
ncbi:Ref family recombination enhancement nuclease, partial [Enterobacter asburiae]